MSAQGTVLDSPTLAVIHTQVNPVASLLMAIAVGLVILYLFGELYALKIRFNEVSVINMVSRQA
jgi:hypothetical protein